VQTLAAIAREIGYLSALASAAVWCIRKIIKS
jgi:hypothetical protein